jgi:hypothetical protein
LIIQEIVNSSLRGDDPLLAISLFFKRNELAGIKHFLNRFFLKWLYFGAFPILKTVLCVLIFLSS